MIRSFAIAGVGIGLAVATLLLTFAQAGAALNPGFAARLGPASGPVQGTLAASIAKTSSAVARKPVLPAEALALARDAYIREPLSTPAAVLLAGRLVADDPKAAVAVQEAAHRNTRRNTQLSVELLASYGRLGRTADGLAVLDVLLRRQTPLQRDLLGIMTLEVRRSQLQDEYRNLLARHPPWSDQFWRQLAQTPEGLTNAASLRRTFAADGGEVDPQVDALLVGGMAQAGQYEAGEALAAATFPKALARTRNLVRNGDFAAMPVVPPYDWQFRESSDFGAIIVDRNNTLAVSATPGARGEVARQLVRLVPGSAILSMALANPPQTGEAQWLELSLECAGPKGEIGPALLKTTLAERRPKTFAVPCRWAWLRLTLAVPSEDVGLDLEVDRIAIVSTGGTAGS